MTDETDSATDPDSGEPVGQDRKTARETAPMSEFDARAAALGALVLLVGLAISFGAPLLAL